MPAAPPRTLRVDLNFLGELSDRRLELEFREHALRDDSRFLRLCAPVGVAFSAGAAASFAFVDDRIGAIDWLQIVAWVALGLVAAWYLLERLSLDATKTRRVAAVAFALVVLQNVLWLIVVFRRDSDDSPLAYAVFISFGVPVLLKSVPLTATAFLGLAFHPSVVAVILALHEYGPDSDNVFVLCALVAINTLTAYDDHTTRVRNRRSFLLTRHLRADDISVVLHRESPLEAIARLAGLGSTHSLGSKIAPAAGEPHRPWLIDEAEIEWGDVVGTGSFGIVHRGRWRGSEVAIKHLRALVPSGEGDSMHPVIKGNAELLDEAGTLLDLRHPQIVLFMGISISASQDVMLITEFVERGSLCDALYDPVVDLTPRLRLQIARDTAMGMEFLHGSGLVHRDLKPANLLLDTSWRAKIADFGLSSMQNGAVANRHLLGTLAYLCPEALQQRDSGPARDVYSFAITLWELYMQREPWVGEGLSAEHVMMQVVRGHRLEIDPDAMPPEIAHLIESCWAHAPDDRPEFRAIHDALRDCPTYNTDSLPDMDSSALSVSLVDPVAFVVAIGFQALPGLWVDQPRQARELSALFYAEMHAVSTADGGRDVVTDGGSLVCGFRQITTAMAFVEHAIASVDACAGLEPIARSMRIFVHARNPGEALLLLLELPPGRIHIAPGVFSCFRDSTAPTRVFAIDKASGQHACEIWGDAGLSSLPCVTAAARPFPWLVRQADLVLGERLGAGRIGEAMRARLGDRAVVFKRLVARRLGERGQLEFLEHVNLLAQLPSHNNVVGFVAASLPPSPFGIVSEDVGTSLRTVLDRAERVPVASGTVQIARGLAFLHSHGMAHLALSSRNVIVKDSGELAVCDFGLGSLTTATMTKEVDVGPRSPEQLQGLRGDEASDVFALGVVRWEMLSGLVPYAEHAHKPAFELIEGVIEGTVRPGTGDELCNRCWAIDPRERPSVEQLVEGD